MKRFADTLLELDSESDWTADDIRTLGTDGEVLTRFLHRTLEVFQKTFPEIIAGASYISGFKAGYMSLKATTQEMKFLPLVARSDAEFFFTAEPFIVLSPSDSCQHLIVPAGFKWPLLVVKLVASGEYVGFLALVCAPEALSSFKNGSDIESAIPALNRIIGDAVFSHRLRKLSSPLDVPGHISTENELFERICNLALEGTAADGIVLRIYDRESGQLEAKASAGNPRDGQFTPGSIAEHIARRVFDNDDSFGTARTLTQDGTLGSHFGANISRDDEQAFNKMGVFAYMVMRLQSEIVSVESSRDTRIGTLALFHLRPQKFSLRDVALFRTFCERIADDIHLFRQYQQLADNNLLLRAQGSALARAELAALLAHDLGNRGASVGFSVEGFIAKAQKALRERRGADTLNSSADELANEVGQLKQQLVNLKRLIAGSTEDAVDFRLKSVIDSLDGAIGGALERNRMTLKPSGTLGISLHGPRDVLLHVFLNLAINAIEAHRGSRSNKPNIFSIDARIEALGERRTLVMNVADEGPGISPLFQDPNEIFRLSVTTKPGGTGTGLPISRSLLDRFFGGALTLQQRRPALFVIRIPLPTSSD